MILAECMNRYWGAEPWELIYFICQSAHYNFDFGCICFQDFSKNIVSKVFILNFRYRVYEYFGSCSNIEIVNELY